MKLSLTKSSTLWNLAFLFTLLVYAAGLFIPIMEPDAAVYAEIAMEMHDSGNFLSIFHKGTDWLDKPHLPFWMSAISYSIFGVNGFAYKLPGVLFVLLGAFYTFLFGKRFYSRLHGYVAVLILITAQHIIISNQDVRAEPFMTALAIMRLYHFAVFLSSRKFLHAIIGCAALAGLIMTKGIFTIIPIGAGIGLSLLYKRQWKSIFHWQWLVCGLLTFVFLFPSLYGYYLQFDQHPEKKIFGQQGVSGVEFFLWTSQWGRFTNTGPIKGKGDLFFFVHTLIWAFLPWAFLAFFALYHKTKQLIRRTSLSENYTYFGFITLFLVFSVSRFQLSFYLNPLFPFLAIITTAVLLKQKWRTARVFSIIDTVVCCLLFAGVLALHYFFLGNLPHVDTIVVLLTGMGIAIGVFTLTNSWLKKIIFGTALVILSVNYYLSREFYPALLKYQSESELGYYMKAAQLPADQLIMSGDVRSVADVILHRVIPVIAVDSLTASDASGKYVYTGSEGLNRMDSLGLKYQLIKSFEDFHVTMLTGKFINRKTRSEAVKIYSLVKVEDNEKLKR